MKTIKLSNVAEWKLNQIIRITGKPVHDELNVMEEREKAVLVAVEGEKRISWEWIPKSTILV